MTYHQCGRVTKLSIKSYSYWDIMTMTMTMTMILFYSAIDIQIEIIMYNSLENQIINWSGDYY